MGLGGFNGVLPDFRAEDLGSVFLDIYQHVETAHSSSVGGRKPTHGLKKVL